jgi:Protein of unknown function (DUF2478)
VKGTIHRFATLSGADSPRLQALLATAVAEWKAAGVRVAGVIAEAHNLPNRACSAGFLRDIGSGKAYSMFLETPPSGTSYHLYATGVEGACAAVLGQIIYSDVVVLSKFGKLEAAWGGLAPAFTAPIAAGKPVLTTVSDLHQAACYGLAPDALRLPAGAAAIRDWWAEIGVSCRVARPSLCARFRSAAKSRCIGQLSQNAVLCSHNLLIIGSAVRVRISGMFWKDPPVCSDLGWAPARPGWMSFLLRSA